MPSGCRCITESPRARSTESAGISRHRRFSAAATRGATASTAQPATSIRSEAAKEPPPANDARVASSLARSSRGGGPQISATVPKHAHWRAVSMVRRLARETRHDVSVRDLPPLHRSLLLLRASCYHVLEMFFDSKPRQQSSKGRWALPGSRGREVAARRRLQHKSLTPPRE